MFERHFKNAFRRVFQPQLFRLGFSGNAQIIFPFVTNDWEP